MDFTNTNNNNNNNKETTQNIESLLSKRKYSNAFDKDGYDDERYGQHIDDNFFIRKIGHCAHQDPPPPTKCRETINSVITGFNQVLSNEKIELLKTSCENVEETVAWCEKYLALSRK